MNTKTANQTVDLEKFLAYVACLVRNLGYVNNEEAKEKGIESTAQLAWEWATKMRPHSLRNLVFEPEDRATGKTVAEWMRNLDRNVCLKNEYMGELHGIGLAGVISQRYMGYAASAVESMKREQKRDRENDPKNPKNSDKFLGEIGEKISIQVKYVGKSQFDTRFGLCHKYIFEDGEGRKISWMTSTEMTAIQQGSVYQLKGTIKKHSSFKGNFETEITRASVGGK